MADAPDLVTLSWCLGEIRDALSRTEAALEKHLRQVEADDLGHLRAARNALHQAHGAMLIVDVPGAPVLTEEAEALLAAVESGELALSADGVSRLSSAFRACVEYLEDLLGGAPAQPVLLFPYLKPLLEARGAERVHPADLFDPDLSRRLPLADDETDATRAAADAGLATARGGFEKGLLQFLRDPARPDGVESMRAAVAGVRRSSRGAPSANFWRVAEAFFAALRDGALTPDVYAKRLLARINIQLRKTIDEGAPIADRLFKDTLFSIACARRPAGIVAEVWQVYALDGRVPQGFEAGRYGRVDIRALRDARDALVRARTGWDKLAQGGEGESVALAQALDAFAAATARLPGEGMRSLAAAMIDTRRALSMREGPIAEPFALEFATAILCAEQMLEHGHRGGEALDGRAGEMAQRLRDALKDAGTLELPLPDWLREMSQLAQERLTMAAFIGESLANLRSSEKELDAFFADPSQRDGVMVASRLLTQVGGALRLLGHVPAADGAAAVVAELAVMADDPQPPTPERCERIASSLGALGFFVEGLRQPDRPAGRFEFDPVTGQFSAFLGESARSAQGGDAAAVPSGSPAFETILGEHAREAEGLLATLRETPGDEAVRGRLRDTLEKVRSDAELIDDPLLGKTAREAIQLLGDDDRLAAGLPAAGDAGDAGDADAAGTRTVTSARGDALSPDVDALMAAELRPRAPVAQQPEPDDDDPLLQIFLDEAREVLEGIAGALTDSRAQPCDTAPLTTIRRGFHTLKGSSRMVGLGDVGAAGWAMEQVMNQLLADQHGGSPALYQLIDYACARMGEWVAALSADPTSKVDASLVVEPADAFRAGRAPVYREPVVLPAPTPATPVAAEPPVASAAGVLDMPAIDADVQTIDVPALDADALSIDVPALDADALNIDVPALDADPLNIDVPLLDELAPIADLPGLDAAAPAVELPVLDVAAPAIELPAIEGEVPTLDVPVLDAAPLANALPVADTAFAIDAPAVDEAAGAIDAPPVAEAVTAVDVPAVADLAPTPVRDAADDALPPPPVHPEVRYDAFNASLDAAIAAMIAAQPATPATVAGPPDTLPAAATGPEPTADAHRVDAGESGASSPAVAGFDDEDAEYVQVGELRVGRPLYMIFLGEADDLIATLIDDTADWRRDPSRPASERAMRAAHSLAGSAAVVGLTSVHDVADRLEHVYEQQSAQRQPLVADDLALVSRAVDRLQVMLHRFAAGSLPRESGDIVEALDALIARLRWTVPLDPSSDALEPHDGLQATAAGSIGADAPAAFVALAAVDPDLPQAAPAADVPDDAVSVAVGADAGHDDVAALETAPSDASPRTVVADELDPDLLPIFVEEAADHLPAIAADLRAWAGSPTDASIPQRLMRALHTVKGSARMAGAMTLGQRMHELETRIEALAVLPTVPRDLIDDLIADHDVAVQGFESLRTGFASGTLPAQPAPLAGTMQSQVQAQTGPTTPTALPAAHDTASAGAPQAAPVVGATEFVHAAARDAAAEAFAATGLQPAVPAAPGDTAAPRAPAARSAAASQLVRVRAELLDRLVNEAGEVSIARAKVDNELSGLRQALVDLTENVTRLRTHLREIEIQGETQIQARIAQSREAERAFDPLEFDRFTRFQELTRMLAESVSDVSTVQHNATRSLDEANQELARQGQVLRGLQQNLMRVRMVQFGTIADRLYRVVRQSAKETGKRVDLDIRGSGVEIDRGVLEAMAGPLEHLLRNAVAHGIEPRERRLLAGKRETGEITLEARQEGNEVVLALADDGGGLDLARIREKAVAQGLLPADATPADRELAELIFAPGFSTAAEVTELAGRGVGMDVVRAQAAELGGRIETDSDAGRGTRFTIRLPLTLAVAQVVLVSAGDQRYAVPAASVEQVVQFKPAPLATAYADGHVERQGARLPLFWLGALVDAPHLSPVAQQYSPVLVLRSGGSRIALHADAVSRTQEVVVKNVGPQVSRVRGVSGATVMGNGDIVLIVNPVVLAQAAVGSAFDRFGQAGAAPGMMLPASLDVPATVMVVDDSVTVRKVTQRLLSREGYQVVLAKDGVDALRQLQDGLPDVMLVDIEMPRMDGFDLTRHVRADERLRNIPVVMITSRTADKHRNMAMSLGVDAFLGKPYDEADLLSRVAEFVRRQRGEGGLQAVV